jgi:hypothetical protein
MLAFGELALSLFDLESTTGYPLLLLLGLQVKPGHASKHAVTVFSFASIHSFS